MIENKCSNDYVQNQRRKEKYKPKRVSFVDYFLAICVVKEVLSGELLYYCIP